MLAGRYFIDSINQGKDHSGYVFVGTLAAEIAALASVSCFSVSFSVSFKLLATRFDLNIDTWELIVPYFMGEF